MTDFAASIARAYAAEGPTLDLGRGVREGELHQDAVVGVPLAMMNRHGLIAGATGTGKTVTLQVIAEQLSAAGVPVVAADVKGDLSGLAAPGEADGAAARRMAELGLPYEPSAFPVELFSLGGIGPGVPIRATVTDFGPQLLAKVLDANETQEQSLALVFRFADEHGLPLLDLADLRSLLTYLGSEQGRDALAGIGGVSKQTLGVLLRTLVQLEDAGGTEFFGEPQLEIADLMRTAEDGRGIVSCLELPAVLDKPRLWSTALMWLLAELFEELPEVGDLEKPKLVFFFEEAHLLFTDATKAFLESVVQTVRMIRSKGVGVFFCTQVPKDVDEDVLAQLGNRVQHALRAFTPNDAKALKAAVSTYPVSEFYDLEELLPSLGIGEAVVTVLSEDGVPTPVVHTRMRAPRSRMGPADDLEALAAASPLQARYGTREERESARERLAAKLEAPDRSSPAKKAPKPERRHREAARASRDGGDVLADFLASRQGKALARDVVRGVFGMLRKRL